MNICNTSLILPIAIRNVGIDDFKEAILPFLNDWCCRKLKVFENLRENRRENANIAILRPYKDKPIQSQNNPKIARSLNL